MQIPLPSDQNSLNKAPDTVFSVIQVDTLAYRALIDDRAVRKNVSLPAWMSKLADKNHINCSKVLQDGLLAEFKKIRA